MQPLATPRLLLAPLTLAWLIACVLAVAAHAQAAPAAPAIAQDTEVLRAGARVRLTIVDSQVVVGRLVAVTDSALAVAQTSRDTLHLDRRSLARIEVSRGGSVGRGMKLGALIGGVTGGLVGAAMGESCTDNDFICFDYAETIPAGIAGGIAAGVLIGAVFGSRERWRSLDRAPALALAPSEHGGISLRGRITF
jgi:hypothetical protein